MKETRSGKSADRPVVVWFRDDLRIADHPALHHAAEQGAPIIALYVHDEKTEGIRAKGAAQKWFLHHCLSALAAKLDAIGGRLDILTGASEAVLKRVAGATGARAVYWLRRTEAAERELDRKLKTALRAAGIEAGSFNGNLLHEPARLLTQSGGPYRVYTPFWRAFCNTGGPRLPLPAPKRLTAGEALKDTVALADLGLLPARPDWARGWDALWPVGEDGAARMLSRFLDGGLQGYAEGRDLPAKDHVSRLSPYLRFGAISPYQVWHAARHALTAGMAGEGDAGKFLQELGWREFCHHLLFHHPDLASRNFQEKFDRFAWRDDAAADLECWRRGRTGYPIVDAGMRELWRTGYMHNRVRMIAASFLIKHLRIDWREGETWFWDTLVDGDPASNPASWQWVAGSGADAAPYFRIFNPILQGEKFDPHGAYIRRHLPELAELPDRHLHRPWEAPKEVLAGAGVALGQNYPRPIVDHARARARALAAFKAIGDATGTADG
ncbi:MAG: deoxyribodipyrimidine photo-lyase [Nitratireductor sp.]|nr:deoxyribodipyrimidine photo-lyase [Nitratireductor sp.]